MGQVTVTINPLGARTSMQYDAVGQQVRLTNPVNGITTTVYNAAGEQIQVTNPVNQSTSSRYDAASRPVATINPLGARTTTIYDAAGQTIATVNPVGLRSTTVYDAAGRVTQTISPLDRITTTLFDVANQPLVQIDPLDQRTTSVYDLAGRVIATADPLGFLSTTVYDAAGQVTRTVNPLQEIATTLYDNAGRPLVQIDPLSYRTSTTYDAAGQAIQTINARNYRTTTVYDAVGRSIATINALGNRSTRVYDQAGQQIADVNASGQRATTVYDPAGRVFREIDRLGYVTQMTYDAAGQQLAVKNPLGQISSTVYDAAGQVVATIDPLLNRTTTVYDSAGRTVASINGVGNRTTTQYDGASRPQVTINGLGVRTTTVYDLLDRPIGLVDGNDQRTTFGYDAVGNKILELNPLLARLTSSYDALRRQTLRIDPRGVRVSTSYNPLGKPVSVLYPDGTRSTTTYDAVSNRILLADSTGRYTRTYDPLNRTAVSQQPSGGRLSFSWDAVGQRRLMVDVSGGRTSYSHDAQGQLQTLINPRGEITSYTYDQAGQRVMTQLANETWQQTVHDAAGRVVQLNEYQSDPSVLSWSTLTVAQWSALTVDQWAVLPVNPLALTHQLTYAVDAADRRTVRSDLTGDRTTWTYDDASQLTGESRTGAIALSVTWTYDPAGNRISQTRDGELTSYTIDPANRVLRATTVSGATTYSYDAAGNQTAVEIPAGDITTTVWDAESRQQAVEQPDGSRVTFTYNSDHWRVTREDEFATTNFLFDKNNLLAELDDSHLVQVQYTNEPNEYGNVISQYRTTDDESSFYAYDAPGSTVHLTDAAMVVTDEYDYEAFGAALATTGTTENSIRYIGKLGYYLDQQLGTYHVRRRQYDQILARFKSEDPLRQEGGNDNLYEYASNNPVNRTDATGLADRTWGEWLDSCKIRIDTSKGPGPWGAWPWWHGSKPQVISSTRTRGTWGEVANARLAISEMRKHRTYSDDYDEQLNRANKWLLWLQEEITVTEMSDATFNRTCSAIEEQIPNVVSLAVDFTPVVGGIRSLIDAVTGKNIITGEELTKVERIINVIGALLELIPVGGKVARLVGPSVLNTLQELVIRLKEWFKTAAKFSSQLSREKADYVMKKLAVLESQVAARLEPVLSRIDPRPPQGAFEGVSITGDLPVTRPPSANSSRVNGAGEIGPQKPGVGNVNVPSSAGPQVVPQQSQLQQALPPKPKIEGEALGYWQKQFRNKKVTEAELRQSLHPDSVDKILSRIGKQVSGVHDPEKIIDSICKSSAAVQRAAEDLANGRITRQAFDAIVDQDASISAAQRIYLRKQFDD